MLEIYFKSFFFPDTKQKPFICLCMVFPYTSTIWYAKCIANLSVHIDKWELGKNKNKKKFSNSCRFVSNSHILVIKDSSVHLGNLLFCCSL